MFKNFHIELPWEVVEIGALVGLFALSGVVVALSVAGSVYGGVVSAASDLSDLLPFTKRHV